MISRDAYFFQIMRKYNSENGGVKEAYKEVCRHLEEVEAAKRALEDALEREEEKDTGKERIHYLDRVNQITDEMIQLLEDAGYDLKSDDWKTNWEEMIKQVEEWEMGRKKRWEEEQRKRNENI